MLPGQFDDLVLRNETVIKTQLLSTNSRGFPKYKSQKKIQCLRGNSVLFQQGHEQPPGASVAHVWSSISVLSAVLAWARRRAGCLNLLEAQDATYVARSSNALAQVLHATL